MKKVDQGDVISCIVDGGGISARAASERMGRTQTFVQNVKAKAAPSVGTVALVGDVYGYDVALVNRKTGEVDYTIEPPK